MQGQVEGGQRGSVIWIVGKPAAGKTTLARLLLTRLRELGEVTLWLDSDELRSFLTPAPTYSDSERDWFYGVVAHLARLGAAGGATVVVSATAPRRRYRDELRAQLPRFTEVYLTCDRDLLARRDHKSLYARADAAQITNLPGVGAVFEPPSAPELTLDSGSLSPAELADAVMSLLSGPARAEARAEGDGELS